jgi:17beta-estradiol 17-dehydrogenase / very-long-chain 3-oxoacyl-CoA reductase
MQVVFIFLFIIGLLRAVQISFGCLDFVKRRFLRKKLNLKKRYAKSGDEWIVVTGASDGIGAEYCKEFAKDGFNIVLVSRTLSKLKSVESQLQKLNPKIKTRIVQADFNGNSNMEYYNKLMSQMT